MLDAEGVTPALAESAFPAYVRGNALSRKLFWSRIWHAARFMQNSSYSNCLDFGCGSGVMLPLLAETAKRVVGCDLDLAPFRLMQTQFPFPENVEVTDFAPDPASNQSCFDLIVALDVLEHVDDLGEILSQFHQLLSPQGALLVSGPTENLLYRVGRRIAGREFTGHYHHRTIYDIRAAMVEHFHVQTWATLYYPIPLFKLYAARPN